MHDFPVIQVGGFNIDLSTWIAILVSCIIVFVLARLAVRNLSVSNPSKLQNFLEWAVEFVHSTIASSMSFERAKKFIALGLTIIMFIFVSNLLGLPFGITTEVSESHHGAVTVAGMEIMSAEKVQEKHDAGKHIAFAWWKSPTADLSVTAGLALIVLFLVHFLGLRDNKKHYLQHYFKPYPIFFPLNIIEQIARPVTLALRLFANIFAGEVLIATILMLGWVGFPLLAIWQGFSIFVGAIQAFLFTMLTFVYIGQTVEHDEEEHA